MTKSGGRFTASVDAYHRVTTDLLNYTPVAALANLKNYLDANIGTLENNGVEVDLNIIPIETRDFSWQIGLNGAYNHQLITKLTTNDGDGYKGVDCGPDLSAAVGNKIQKHMTGLDALLLTDPISIRYASAFARTTLGMRSAEHSANSSLSMTRTFPCVQSKPYQAPSTCTRVHM